MACTCPGGRPIKAATLGDVNVCLCNIQWLTFNAGPGVAQWDDQEAFNSIQHPGVPFSKVWFRCGDLVGGSQGFERTPGWKIDAGIATEGPDGSKVYDTWQMGIIQTVESEVWEGFYEDEWGRKAMATKGRDGDKSATAPWYAPAGADGEPILVKNVPKNDNHPTISDDPTANFFFAHPDALCKQLMGASIKGTYHLWLIGLDPKGPLDGAHITYLWHATIVVDKRWERKWGDDPQLLSNWKGTGTQTQKDVGPGKGSHVPVLAGAVANDQLTFSTHKTGKPCPPPAGTKKP